MIRTWRMALQMAIGTLLVLLTASERLAGQDGGRTVNAVDVYDDRSLSFSGGEYRDEIFHYRLMKPMKIEAGKKYPLVIFLHGAGERGVDNQLQLLYFPTQMAQPDWRSRYPCFVLAPQCRPDRKWMEVDWASPKDPVTPDEVSEQSLAVEQMIQRTLDEEPIDRDRVYLTGLSMGGFGSFDLAARHPDWFAAVAPICGAADPARVIALKNVPLYIVHGDKDAVVSVERSRSAVAALKAAGGNPTYVELPEVGHNSWTPAYSDPKGLVPWMFLQQKSKQ